MTLRQVQAIKNSLGEPDYDEVIQAIAGAFQPEEIFDKEVLQQWALDNGYVEESD